MSALSRIAGDRLRSSEYLLTSYFISK